MRARYLLVPCAACFGTALYNAVLPLLVVDMGGGASHYAALNLVYGVVYAVSGRLLPRALRGVSRRGALAACCAALAAAALATAWAPCLALLALIQVPYAAASALSSVLQASVSVELWRGPKGIPLLYAATSVGWVASLAAGSALRAAVGLRELLLASAAGFLAASLASLALPPAGTVEAGGGGGHAQGRLVERARAVEPVALAAPRGPPALRPFLASALAAYTAIGAFFTVLPVYLKREAGVDDATLLALSATAGAASLALHLAQSGVAERLGVLWRAHAAALALRCLLFASPPLLAGCQPLLFALYACIGATWAFIGSPQSVIASSLAPPGSRDEVLGALGACTSAGLVAGYAVAALADAAGYQAVFAASSALMAVAASLALYALKLYEVEGVRRWA